MNEKGESTLRKYEKYLKVKNYSDNTVKMYMYYAKEFVMYFDKPALHILSSDAKEYIYNYNYTSVSNQNQVYSSLKHFCREILNFRVEKIFPERPRKEKKLPRVIDRDFLVRRINAIENKKHKAILWLAFSTGMRVSEVINLNVSDVDSSRMVINIRNAKGRKDRIVPLSVSTLNVLRDYYKEYKPNERMFNGQSSLYYSVSSCNNLIKKYIGMDYSFHSLRHSCFTSMVEMGTDVSIVQKIAGHEKLSTTSIYLHISKNAIKNAVPVI